MVKEIEVKWLKEKSGHKPGDIIKIDEKLAEQLVKKWACQKIAKQVNEEFFNGK